MSPCPRLVVSLGDPCGIGPELLLGSLPKLRSLAEIIVVGSRAGVDLLEGQPAAKVAWRWVAGPGEANTILQVMNPADPTGTVIGEARWLDPTPDIVPGQLKLGRGSAASGLATVEAVRAAAHMAMRGEVDALVTLPMAKSAAHQAGYDIPGHTEFLRDLSGATATRMAFVSPRMNVVLHTVHQSLRSVVETLATEAVAETLVFAAKHFIRLTGRAGLRVALCALNPHAGEEGAFGGEERLLDEALLQARAAFPSSEALFSGPLPSDSIFQRASRGEFDLVVALYHDQGLIPVKLLEPERAVNLTLGLPFIRTSPDHGTAFDKAGKWVADARNFLEAAALAVRLAERKQLSLTAGPRE